MISVAELFLYFFQPPPVPLTREIPWLTKMTPGAADAIEAAARTVHRLGYYAGVKDGLIAGIGGCLAFLLFLWIKSTWIKPAPSPVYHYLPVASATPNRPEPG